MIDIPVLSRGVLVAKYLYWRNNSLWCRYPLPDKPAAYALDIHRFNKSKAETDRCLRLAELRLSEWRVASVTGELTAKRVKEYSPTFRRLCRRYWCNHLRWEKSGMNERYHLVHSYKHFGPIPAKEITRDDIENWRQKMIRDGSSINSVNNRYAYMQAVYSWSNSESDPKKRLNYDPTVGIKKVPNGKVRTFLLTPEKFERNYGFLKNGEKWKPEHKPKHAGWWKFTPDTRFAFFYLMLWETGRRPEEVSQYTWEMVNTVEVKGREIHIFSVPPEINKTNKFQNVIISSRLWYEMSQLAYRKGLVARNEDGNRWQHWDRHKMKLDNKFGSDAGWIRDTRRGFVTRKRTGEGFDESIVMMQSGHTTREIFRRYDIKLIEEQAKMFEQIVENEENKTG